PAVFAAGGVQRGEVHQGAFVRLVQFERREESAFGIVLPAFADREHAGVVPGGRITVVGCQGGAHVLAGLTELAARQQGGGAVAVEDRQQAPVVDPLGRVAAQDGVAGDVDRVAVCARQD